MTTPVPAAPGTDDFRALARSSPWRFTLLHFTHRRFARPGAGDEMPVEAWLDRRANRVTVRSERGVDIADGVPYSSIPSTAVLSTWPASTDVEPQSAAELASDEPVRRPDGLIASRPWGWEFSHGDPMWRDYRWTAMVDPAELSHGVQLEDVAAGTLRGRATWSAICRPLPGVGADWEGGYEPRCGCCPLLDSAASRLLEYGPDDPIHDADGLPTAYRVQLDVQTAIVVRIEALDGRAGAVLSNEIIDVDEPLHPPSP